MHGFERKVVNIFLSISFNIGFVCSKEPSHRDGFLSTHNICFGREIRKLIFIFALLSRGQGYPKILYADVVNRIIEPQHEISNNVAV